MPMLYPGGKRRRLNGTCNMNWTQSRIQSFIKSALRSGSQRWPPRYEALNEAKRGKFVNESTGRLAEHYECAMCHKLFPAKSVVVDHIEPVVPVSGFSTWDEVISRMFCPVSGLQVLCKEDHKIKTKEENDLRRANTKNKK